MSAEVILFWIFAVLTVGCALGVVLSKSPISSAMALVGSFFFLAGLYVLLLAHTIAALQVLVYAGAIMVLILFVIMLLNLREEAKAHPVGTFQRVLAPLATLIFAIVIGRAVYATAPSTFSEKVEGFGTAASIGQELFSRFYYPFEAISLLLIVAMVGAVLLAKRRLS